MADYATLVFDIDSTQARGAAKALGDLNSAAIKAADGAAKLGSSMRGADGRFQSAIKLSEGNRQEIENLAKAYNPVLAAQIKYRDESIKTSAAVKAGVISEQQRVVILKQLKSELDGTAAALRRVEAEERKAAAAADRAAASLSKAASSTKVMGQQQEVATHHATNLSFQLNDIGMMMASGQNPFLLMMQQGSQVSQIFGQMSAEGRKIGPTLVGAFRSFLSPMTLVTMAVIGGTAALAQWAMSAGDAEKGAKTYGDQLDKLSGLISNLGSGSISFDADTKAMKANLGEIVSRYGEMNASVRTHITLLRQAQTAALSLATIDPMKAFRETFKDGWLTGNVDEVRIALNSTNDAARGVIAQFKAVDEAKGLSNKRIEAEELVGTLIRLTGGFDNMNSKQIELVLNLQRGVDELRAAEEQARRNQPHFTNMAFGAAQVEQALSKLPNLLAQGEMNLRAAERQTAAWEASMDRVRGQAAAISQILAGISGTQIAAASAKVQADIIERTGSIKAASRAGAEYEANAARLSRVGDLVGQNVEYYKAAAIAQDEFTASMQRYDAQARLATVTAAQQDKERKANSDAKKAESESKRAAKSAAAAAKAEERKAAAEINSAEKGFQSLRELLDKQSAYQVVEYEKRLGQLNTALGKQLIAEKSYQDMRAQLQLTYFGSEYEKNAVNYSLDLEQLSQLHAAKLLSEEQYQMARKQLQHDYYSDAINVNQNQSAQQLSNMAADFAQMNQLAGGGYDKLLRAQKTFAAGAALVNAYLAATQALADPTVGFWGKFAAYAKVLAAGMGAVNAIKGGSGGGGGGAASSAGSVKQEPTKNVLIRLEGDDWLTGLAEQMMTQIYEASSNGRVIVSRDNS